MSLKDDVLATFAILLSVIGMAIAVGHVFAISASLVHGVGAFSHVYHMVFATITCWLAGFVLSIISIKSGGGVQGVRALSWNIISMIVIGFCLLVVRSFGAF